MSEETCSVTATDKFYDAIATQLGLPKFTGVSGWDRHGRVIAPSAYARGVVDGIVVYGIEATYIVKTRPQHEPAIGDDYDEGEPEPKPNPYEQPTRAPLAYFTEAKRFDAFPGFTVTSDCACESQPNTSFAGLTLDGCGAFVLPKQAY